MTLISDQKIAIIAETGVNQNELAIAREQLEKHSIAVDILSVLLPEVKAWDGSEWGIRIKVDNQIQFADPLSYHAVIIPGGPLHSDALRNEFAVTTFIREVYSAGKPLGAIGHGLQVLINCEVLKGRKVTGPASIKKDIQFARGIWSDEKVCSDNGLITCQTENEIRQFMNVFIETLRQGIRQQPLTII
jgi:protease I